MNQQRTESRPLNDVFNISDYCPPTGDSTILNNVCFISNRHLSVGNILPLIVNKNWTDAKICAYYQVVQMDFLRNKVTMQLANEDVSLPNLGTLDLDAEYHVYALTQFGILSIGNFMDNPKAVNIPIIAASSDSRAGPRNSHSSIEASSLATSSIALLTKSASAISAKEEAKTMALRRILYNNEADVRFFLANSGLIDNWHCLSAAALRLPDYIRIMPSFSGDNLKSFVLLRFSHIPSKECWYIGSMAMGTSGHFSSINGIIHALPNLEQAFAHIFKHNSSGINNILLTNALAQWKNMLNDQCEATSIKNLPVDFIERKIMESICNFAQALIDPSLDRIHDPDIINARVVAATAVDARAMRADGDRVRLNRLDNKGQAKSMSSPLPAGGGKRKIYDAIGPTASNQPWKQIGASNSSASSAGFKLEPITPQCLPTKVASAFHACITSRTSFSKATQAAISRLAS